MRKILLGVNIDHVATLRQVRGTNYPAPIVAARLAAAAGADSITVHLREDRRHIQRYDVEDIAQHIATPLNLEIAVSAEMLGFAEQLKPEYCCLVPEKRQELTTEGGLDVQGNIAGISAACQRLTASGIQTSLFTDADADQIYAAKESGATCIEIHTGHYADASSTEATTTELEKIVSAVHLGRELGLRVHAGHGLTLENVAGIASIDDIVELNIGHSIIARAVFVGMEKAVGEMKEAIASAITQP